MRRNFIDEQAGVENLPDYYRGWCTLKLGRVEMWRGGLGRSLYSLFARPFVCECHKISTMLRFHTPLIEPDVRISRIRLSDQILPQGLRDCESTRVGQTIHNVS
jgi:hypothetical protein